jgi:hypothetical protein
MREAGGRLLVRAQEAGEVRGDVTAGELLALAAGVAWAGERSGGSPDLIRRLLSYTMEGLQAGGPAPAAASRKVRSGRRG